MRLVSGEARVVSLEALLDSEPSGESCVAITFDDGYATVVERAAPAMNTLGFVGTVFVTAGWVGTASRRASDPDKGHYPGERFMTWEDLQALRAQGWTIGSHGVEHDDLTAVSTGRLEEELAISRTSIAENVGAPCEHYAYTWGLNDARVRKAVRRAGYASAATTIHGPVTEGADRFALPRMDVTPHCTLSDFAAIVRGEWDYLGVYQRARSFARSIRLGGKRSS